MQKKNTHTYSGIHSTHSGGWYQTNSMCKPFPNRGWEKWHIQINGFRLNESIVICCFFWWNSKKRCYTFFVGWRWSKFDFAIFCILIFCFLLEWPLDWSLYFAIDDLNSQTNIRLYFSAKASDFFPLRIFIYSKALCESVYGHFLMLSP